MTLTGPTARPIRFTDDLPAWRRILTALGGTPVHEARGWVIYQLGSGRVALHGGAGDDGEQAGATTLCVETPAPLEEAVGQVRAAGVQMELEETNHGRAGVHRSADGTLVTLDPQTPADPAALPRDTRLAVLPIWYAHDVPAPRSVVEGLGAAPELIADAGTWTELTFPGGGRVGIHRADTSGIELGFWWDGDVEDALRLLMDAGVDAVLIDETYSRTVQVADPDGLKEIWINERQTDLYGYTRAIGSSTVP
jgi:hypothetical protein